MNQTIFERNPSTKFPCLSACSPSVSQLFIRGKYPDLLSPQFNNRRIGIVGTRDASNAGMFDARRIAQVVAKAGCIVVSGMAIGIDGAAHQGAIDVAGCTIAVLGSGLDVIYPIRHLKLANQIQENGCIISEFDCDTKALAWHFPIRNRIIAALSDVLVVPEGTLRGGARITVDLALAMGKTICAIPGPRRSKSSELPNSIIKDGAAVITDPSDVLNQIGIYSKETGWELEMSSNATNRKMHDDLTQKILKELSHSPLRVDEITKMFDDEDEIAILKLKEMEQSNLIAYRRGMYEIYK